MSTNLASAPSSDAARWAALRAREDAPFFYSVSTTGVYCRPSCAARPARPEHVAFYDTPAAAEAQGFRPCKRCRPNEPPLAERQAAQVAALCRFIDAQESPPTLDTLAAHAGLSPFYVQRLFKQVTGVSPKQYAAARRANRMQNALAGSSRVTEALYDAGYSSSARFYETSTQRLGMTPSQVRRGGAREQIRFAVGECSLGSYLVAATARGVCAITLGDDAETLLHDLEARFPHADLIGGEAAFEALVTRVVAVVEGHALPGDLSLDIRGTAFQERVWRALAKVPAGTTTTYTEIAAAIGAPRSVRAVAAACAANPVAIVVPCHRVVRRDGALAGYRWGIERKRALLRREEHS